MFFYLSYYFLEEDGVDQVPLRGGKMALALHKYARAHIGQAAIFNQNFMNLVPPPLPV